MMVTTYNKATASDSYGNYFAKEHKRWGKAEKEMWIDMVQKKVLLDINLSAHHHCRQDERENAKKKI